MEISTRVRVKTVLDSVSSALSGGKAFHEIAAGLLRGLEWARKHLQTVDTNEKVNAFLDGCDEPTPQQVRTFEAMTSVIPAALNGFVREKLLGSIAQLPGSKMGRKTIPNSEKRAMCDQVAALIRSGCTPGAAKFRVAQRSDCTTRTVSRVWLKRGDFTTDLDAEKVQAMLGALFSPCVEPEGQTSTDWAGEVPRTLGSKIL